MRSVLAMVLATIGLVAVAAVPAMACSCATFTTEQAFKRADVVATGVLRDIQEPPAATMRSSTDPVTYTATVESTYKGRPSEELVFTSALYGASCGLEGMEEGERYVFFLQRVGAKPRWLNGEPGDLVGSLCGGTRRAGGAVDARLVDIAGPPTTALDVSRPQSPEGVGRVEVPPGSAQAEPRRSGSLPWALGLMGLAALVASGSWRVRRRGQRPPSVGPGVDGA